MGTRQHHARAEKGAFSQCGVPWGFRLPARVGRELAPRSAACVSPAGRAAPWGVSPLTGASSGGRRSRRCSPVLEIRTPSAGRPVA